MLTSSSVSSPQQVESHTCKCGLIAKYFTAPVRMVDVDSSNIVVLAHSLVKILKEIGGIEIHKPNIGSNLNEMTFFENSNLEDKVSNLELEHHIEYSNLKNLDDNKLKWKLKGFQLISLLLIFRDIIVGFVAAKLI
ncbi:hypothetical protein H5410_048403 [Solanum commersonii]|uniref:Uncharacterized protein n=1 Tax=Solanum commersonii TaxID=4109 RepID=A0A9J5XHZ8_SOLCO|nr:hypothetical protein H5410_048403 [Solanum commersonii]